MSFCVDDRLMCRFGWNQTSSIQTRTLDGYLHTVTYNRCINTIDSSDDEQKGCSKHVENWNKYIRKKNCASSCLFTRTERRCTVNKI